MQGVRGSGEAEVPGGLADARGRPGGISGSTEGWAVPGLTFSTLQSASRSARFSVDRDVRLAENKRQLRQVDKRRPAEGVAQLSV